MKFLVRFKWILAAAITLLVIAGFPYAFVRDLILHKSGMGAVGKINGFISGIFDRDLQEQIR